MRIVCLRIVGGLGRGWGLGVVGCVEVLGVWVGFGEYGEKCWE